MTAMNTERVATALRALLTRQNDDAFVIFEESASGKFVQFAGSSHESLLLDLPSIAMTPAELERAAALFGQQQQGPTDSGYQRDFGNDADRASEFTMRIFREIYHLPPSFSLSVEEN